MLGVGCAWGVVDSGAAGDCAAEGDGAAGDWVVDGDAACAWVAGGCMASAVGAVTASEEVADSVGVAGDGDTFGVLVVGGADEAASEVGAVSDVDRSGAGSKVGATDVGADVAAGVGDSLGLSGRTSTVKGSTLTPAAFVLVSVTVTLGAELSSNCPNTISSCWLTSAANGAARAVGLPPLQSAQDEVGKDAHLSRQYQVSLPGPRSTLAVIEFAAASAVVSRSKVA